MGTKIKIECGDISLAAELNDTDTAGKVAAALPIEGSVNTWGEEVYFEIPVACELEEGARADVEVGEIGYWPTGRAFCVFFGPTPASTGDKPRAASAVNIIGRASGDSTVLGAAKGGERITILADD